VVSNAYSEDSTASTLVGEAHDKPAAEDALGPACIAAGEPATAAEAVKLLPKAVLDEVTRLAKDVLSDRKSRSPCGLRNWKQ